MSEIGTKAARDMSQLEVPTVEEAIHVGSHGVGKENGGVVGNGMVNGDVMPKPTRTKRA